jgi:hypothetical protein
MDCVVIWRVGSRTEGMMRVASRAPSLILLGLGVVATALLIAGFGAPVGVGVIVGMLVGAAVILALLGMNPQTRSVSWYGGFRSGAASGPPQPDQAAIQRHHQEWMRVAGVDAGALRRVIPVAAVVEVGGARVELVAVELREDGGIAMLVTHTRPPVGQVGHVVIVSVSDDSSTDYTAAGQASGGMNVGTSRHEVRFAPAPPPGARWLMLRIEAFVDPFGALALPLSGPWEFRVEL